MVIQTPSPKKRDPPPPCEIADKAVTLPVVSRIIVEVRSNVGLVPLDNLRAAADTEHLKERLMVRKKSQRGKLESEQKNVMAVNVYRRYRLAVVEQVVDRITSPGRDGQHSRIAVQRECLGIDPRIFPDLVVDKGVKPDRKKSLEESPTGNEWAGGDRV
jgi:hypothetical protein